jgi:hypothetical protein
MTTGFERSSPIACHPDMSNLPAKGYRTIGIDPQIPWPAQERIVCFRGRKFHLLPGSDALARMIRVQTCEGFTQVDADKLILELLSALAWAEQALAVTTLGNWCTAPLNIGKGPMGVGIRGSSRRSICERCSVGQTLAGHARSGRGGVLLARACAEMAYGPVRTPSTQQRPENFLDDLSNSGPAIRLCDEGRATGARPKTANDWRRSRLT